MEIRKITGDDYIPDMIETINRNFETAKAAIEDLNEIINDGDAEFKTVKVGSGLESTDVSYEGTGRFINDGNIETSATMKARNLEVSHGSTFNGETSFNQAAQFGHNATFEGVNTFGGTINMQKDVTIPTRVISSEEDLGVVGAISGAYSFSIEGDYCIVLNQVGSGINLENAFRMTNAKPNQVIHFVANTLAGQGLNIELSPGNFFNIKAKESITLVWNQISQVENTGEWVVIAFSSFNQ